METLLIFLAIAVIQMVAAYSKQKKEAAKKAAKNSVPQPLPPEATEPIPDPFREIREAMGLPPSEAPQKYEEEEEYEEEPEPVHALPSSEPAFVEGMRPNAQLQLYSEYLAKEQRAKDISPLPMQQSMQQPKRKIQIDLSKPEQGILWNAILKEPRYKAKWKSKCYR
jgi:hypothetical protein